MRMRRPHTTDLLALLAGCALLMCATACAPAPSGPPFVVSNLRAEDPLCHMDLKCNRRLNEEDGPTGVLVVFSEKPSYDLAKIGALADKFFGIEDDDFGGEVRFSTIVGADVNDYEGAWWYGELSKDHCKSGKLTLRLHKFHHMGVRIGTGQLAAAVVQGELGAGPFQLLSEPVRIAHTGIVQEEQVLPDTQKR